MAAYRLGASVKDVVGAVPAATSIAYTGCV